MAADGPRRQATIGLRWYVILVAACAWCCAFAADHREVYRDRRNYEVWRIPGALLESVLSVFNRQESPK